MGCDIHAYVEIKKGKEWEMLTEEPFPTDDITREYYKRDFTDEPFQYRNYGLFGFLADVRNYSCIDPICLPKGLPKNMSSGVKEEYEMWRDDVHSCSWLSLEELLEVDYDKIVWDKRVMRQIGHNSYSGACEAEDGEGEHLSLKDFLGSDYFQTLNIMKNLGNPENVRVVFWFDN